MMSGDVKAVMGKEGEGAEAGRRLKQEGSRLVIKGEPEVEAEKVVISAIIPSEEPTLLPYCIKENEEEDCETIGSESNIEEIDKTEVRNILKELAELKRKEAECFDKLARAVPDMRDSEVVVVAKKVRGSELPQCVYQMNECITNPRDFCAALAAGERVYIVYIGLIKQELHPFPYLSCVVTMMWERRKFMSYYKVRSISTRLKKKRRRNPYEEYDRKKLKRNHQRSEVRRPRPPPPLKPQFVRTYKFTVLFRTTNSSQREYELKS